MVKYSHEITLLLLTFPRSFLAPSLYEIFNQADLRKKFIRWRDDRLPTRVSSRNESKSPFPKERRDEGNGRGPGDRINRKGFEVVSGIGGKSPSWNGETVERGAARRPMLEVNSMPKSTIQDPLGKNRHRVGKAELSARMGKLVGAGREILS